jgi:hypothetical protein
MIMEPRLGTLLRLMMRFCATIYIVWVLLHVVGREVVDNKGFAHVVRGMNSVTVAIPPIFGITLPASTSADSFEKEMGDQLDDDIARLQRRLEQALVARNRLPPNLPAENAALYRIFDADIKRWKSRIQSVAELKSPEIRASWYKTFREQADVDRRAAFERAKVWLYLILIPLVLSALPFSYRTRARHDWTHHRSLWRLSYRRMR